MKKRNNEIIYLLVILWCILNVPATLNASEKYVTTKAKSGEGITMLLNRFLLPVNSTNLFLFKKINANKFDKHGGLLKGTRYRLPIVKIPWDKKSLESSIGINDKKIIEKIKRYNDKVEKNHFKTNYKIDGYIWQPLYLIKQKENIIDNNKQPDTIIEPLFGKKLEKVNIKNRKLDGYVFYLISGHGGPDPGAITQKNGYELTEDEYAYDIILRLGRNLISNGAKVYFIVQDSTDGIREDYYLKNNTDEYYYGNDTISNNQKIRLNKRAEIVNKISKKYPKDKQYAIIIHVDSRHTNKRIDIFFYYQNNSPRSKLLAKTMYKTIENKYNKKQPGRGYEGTVKTRNLFMLRNLHVPTVYMELGNIQNPLDQVRILDPNNRQAIANWLCDGIINYKNK